MNCLNRKTGDILSTYRIHPVYCFFERGCLCFIYFKKNKFCSYCLKSRHHKKILKSKVLALNFLNDTLYPSDCGENSKMCHVLYTFTVNDSS